jgi:hypothetical protein
MYMPTHRAGRETRQNPIRLKNLLREAEKQLIGEGLLSPEAEALLAPMESLLGDAYFRRHQSDGLAMFSSVGLFRHYTLPLAFDELVVVSRRFHVKPLLPLLTGDGRFYVLALSQNEVRFLESTRYSVREVELKGVPQGLAEALQYDDKERQLQFHTSTRVGRGEQAAVFHGQGVGADDAKTDILRYFRQIDRRLSALLKGERAPLVFAGVDYLLPIYKEANKYAHLVDEGVLGSPDGVSAGELHDHAWAIVEPHFLKARDEACLRYEQLAGTEQTSNKLAKVVTAAYQGRIEELFVAVGIQQWGIFEPGTHRVHHHREAEPGDEDLLDFAAVHTLLHGGTVYAVAPDQIPDNTFIAAVFRY